MRNLAGWLDIMVGLLITGISIPLIFNKVKMNHTYGIRIAKAFESDANWYAINSYGGKAMAGWAMLLAAFGIIVLLFPDRFVQGPRRIWLLGTLPMLLCIGAAVIQVMIYARKF